MSWKCKKCGQKVSGKELVCPSCAEKMVYECKACGKELDDGKYKYCPACKTDRADKRKEVLLKAGTVVAAVGVVAASVASVAAGMNNKEDN